MPKTKYSMQGSMPGTGNLSPLQLPTFHKSTSA
jgi:hypothetical protein